jgi:phosphoserine aminotransferase
MKKHSNRNVTNFSAGPSALPYEVLDEAAQSLIDYNGLGVSIMEMSHRSAAFEKIIQDAEASARDLLKVPENYEVLFLQGGGNGQFAAVCLNFINLKPHKKADYLVTGTWSEKAADEAKKYGHVNYVFGDLAKEYEKIPANSDWKLDPEASYVYICDNETINGVEFHEDISSAIGDVPLVADCSSNLFSRTIDISKYGCVFAGAQKNFGPAGCTVVIVRKDLIGFALKETPSVFDYKIQAKNKSLFQTPPCYSIYICGLVFKWLKTHGGIEAVDKVNEMKAALVYDTIDNSNGFYRNPVEKRSRSRVTIPFRINKDAKADEGLEKSFLSEAAKQSLRELKGHRSVGGIRAAIFNAISYEEVERLVAFMKEFQLNNQ